jgi:hypothetical protein
MSTSADSGRTIYAVLPPLLAERLAECFESKEGFSAILRNASDQLLADPRYLKSVITKADELEPLIFDDESPSWGIWPLWLDREGLEMCGAIGLILGFRLKAALAEYDVTKDEAVKDAIEGLIEAKTGSEA